jgi:hypothetical protein
LLSPTAAERLAKDRRAPVLLLRAFSDDRQVRREERGINTRPGRFRTFEEAVEEVLDEVGPVIAIGRPGERFTPGGAARHYIDRTGDWQQQVRDYLGRCRVVVMVMGDLKREGLAWEVNELFRIERPSKVIFVAPQLPDGEVKARWNMYAERSGSRLPPYEDGNLVATFDDGWRPWVLSDTAWSGSSSTTGRSTRSYLSAFRQIITARGLAARRPISAVRVVGAILGGFLGLLLGRVVCEPLSVSPLGMPKWAQVVVLCGAVVIGGLAGSRIRRL